MEERRQDLEDDGADADREGHRQTTDNGEARILHEHPAAELEVEREPVEPGAPAPVAELLFVPLHAPEGHQRPSTGLDGIQALLAHQAIRLHLDVAADLQRHARLGGAAAEQQAQARAGCLEPAH